MLDSRFLFAGIPVNAMQITGVSEFQNACIQGCQDLLEKTPDVRHSNFVKVSSTDETYYKISISTPGHYLQVYIYSQNAAYMLDGKHWLSFEERNDGALDELIAHFLTAVERALGILVASG